MAKKKKKRQYPLCAPLSALEKTLYILLILLIIFGGFVLMTALLRRGARFDTEPGLLACANNAHMLVLLEIMLCFYYCVRVASLRSNSQPLFSRRGAGPDRPPHARVYPIFSKLFWVNTFSEWHRDWDRRQKEKKNALFILLRHPAVNLLSWLLPLLLFLLMVTPAITARDSLYSDGRVTVYNGKNQPTLEYTVEDVQTCQFAAHRIQGVRFGNTEYRTQLRLTMSDGNVYTFTQNTFISSAETEDGDTPHWLTGMRHAKRLFAEKVIPPQDTKYLDRVADHNDLTEADRRRLYALFDLTAP